MWALIIIPVVILLIPVILYNGLIAKRNQVRNIFATADGIVEDLNLNTRIWSRQ